MVEFKYVTQIVFLAVYGSVLYAAFPPESQPLIRNLKSGLGAAFLVMIAQSMLKPYDTIFYRPHESVWRAISRIGLIYLAILVFLLFQTPGDARHLLSYLYPDLGKPVERGMHTYDDNCEFTLQNITDNMDHYFLAHLINWTLAALILRDYYVLHFWSLLDEVLELSWQHFLPHFRECWWDHVLLDVIMTNTVGIFIGMQLVRILKMKEYDWLGRKGTSSWMQWDLWLNHRRFGGLCYMIFVISCNFLTGFFLMNALWVPPKNPMTVYRLLLWFFAGCLAFRELYEDVSTWGTPQRAKQPVPAQHRWLIWSITVLEIFCSFKFGRGAGHYGTDPTPLPVVIGWGVAVPAALSYYFYLRFFKKPYVAKTKNQ